VTNRKPSSWREYAILWTAVPSASKQRRLCRKMTYLFRSTFVYINWKNKSVDNFWLPYVFTEGVLFFCIHKHRTLTMLFSIMQNFSSSLCTTILELTARSCRIFSKCNKVADNNLT
jgi:hypothetical protein